MSLVVWLPLTKDLRQQGLDNTSFLSLVSGNSLTNGGKVGDQCLVLTKRQTILGNNSCMTDKKQMSYAYWVKVNTAWSANWLDGIRYVTTDGTSAHISRQEFYTNCTRIGTWFQGSSLSGYIFTPEEWIHLAGTFDYSTGVAKFYINGELKGTSTALDTTHYCRGDFYLGDEGVDISMNDFRLYDHALSPMEVKELAKGLILHYPLNRQGWGQENLVHNSNQFRVGGHATGITPSVEEDGTYKVIAESGNYNYSSSWWKETTGIEDEFVEGENFTVSFWIKSSDANKTTPPTIYLKSGMGYYSMQGKVSESYSQVYYTGTWKKANSLAPHLGWSGLVGTYYICQWKIEKGTIPTPWCPNSSDELATIMDLNGTTEYDCSGYCNNGTRTGTFTWTSDTPKYEVSQIFNDNQFIETNSLPSETQTIACWLNWTTLPDGYTIPIFDYYTKLAIGITGTNRLISYIGSSNGGVGSCVNVSLVTNQWYHIVIVKTGTTTRDVYINGEKITSMANNNYWVGDLDKLLIGCRHKSGAYTDYFKGYICDFRAYATALSADDVKSLYQNCATIDPDGTIRGQIRS